MHKHALGCSNFFDWSESPKKPKNLKRLPVQDESTYVTSPRRGSAFHTRLPELKVELHERGGA